MYKKEKIIKTYNKFHDSNKDFHELTDNEKIFTLLLLHETKEEEEEETIDLSELKVIDNKVVSKENIKFNKSERYPEIIEKEKTLRYSVVGNHYIESESRISRLSGIENFRINVNINPDEINEDIPGGVRLVSWMDSNKNGVDISLDKNRKIYIGINEWADLSSVISYRNLNAYQWSEIDIRFNKGKVELYINKELDNVGYADSHVNSNKGILAIGHRSNDVRSNYEDRMFRGKLKNFKIILL